MKSLSLLGLLALLASCQSESDGGHMSATSQEQSRCKEALQALKSSDLPSESAQGDERVETVSFDKSNHRLSDPDYHRLERFYPLTLDRIERGDSLTMQDIKNLTRAGVADTVIIFEINATRSVYFLTPDDEKELERAGVSQKVIAHMMSTGLSNY
ncbi:MAG: hypothetical protein KR126chlam1_01109 [Chlamydiae bacterium]|nr:hypothetical protein [Chlamydiota bacterium]